MRTSRQDYKDSTYEEARRTCDTLQLKYDGWWVRIEIVHGQGKVFTQTNRELEKFSFQLTTEPTSAVLVGELMYGTQWAQDPLRLGKIFLFDCWQLNDQPLETLDYKSRYALARSLQPRLPRNFERVQNFRIDDYRRIWPEFVESGQFEGVVFRDSKAPVAAPVLRHKNSFREDFLVTGILPGEGKHEGRMGALDGVYANGARGTVGGGFDDSDRIDIWREPNAYIQRWCEVEGKARFDSGALRHPNFVSWRPPGWHPKSTQTT